MRELVLLLCTSSFLWAEVMVKPKEYDFGVVELGRTSEPATFTLTNNYKEKIVIGTVNISGVYYLDFIIMNDECSYRILDPGTSCTVQVSFHPLPPRKKELEQAKGDTVELRREAVMMIPYGIFPSIEVAERKKVKLYGTLRARLKKEK